MSIGKQLIKARQRKNLSQRELADAVDIPQSTLSSIESDKSIPNAILLNQICQYLEVDMTDLLNDDTRIINNLDNNVINGNVINGNVETFKTFSDEIAKGLADLLKNYEKLKEENQKLKEEIKAIRNK